MNKEMALQYNNSALKLKFFKYFEVAKINYRNTVTHPSNTLARSLTVALRVWVFTQLYTVTYAVSNAKEIGGLTVAMVVWGLMLTQSFQAAARPAMSRIIEDEVKTGALAHSINKPYSYMIFHYFGFMGRNMTKVLFNLAVGIAVAWILVGPVLITPVGAALGFFLLMLGYTLDFFIYFVIGILAFWVEDISAFNWIYAKMQMVFGGLILPITLFPGALQKITLYLPFSQLYYGASRLIVDFQPALFVQFFLTQIAWIFALFIIAYFLFKKAMKYVSINGG